MCGRISFFVVTALIVILHNVNQSSCCIGGRYGRYENWPSKGDWEELFMLLTGKYGDGGWGWHSTDSYSYKGVGDYAYGSPPSSSGGSGGGWFSSSSLSSPYDETPSSLFSSSHNHNSGSSASGSTVDTNKMKKALTDYFNSHKNHYVATANAVGIGQTFVDSPGPSPHPSHYKDDSPQLPAGPPYEPPEILNGFGGWSGPDNNHAGPPPPPSAPPPDSPHHWPPPAPAPHYGNSYSGPSSPTIGFNHNSNHNSDNTNRHKNLFQTDYEVFGRHKKRRNGKRRWRNQASPEQQPLGADGQSHAGLTTKPRRPARPPHKRRGYRKQRLQNRRQMRIARRKLNTSFGGYKLDYSRFRF